MTAALWHRLPANFEEQLEVLAPRVAELHFDDGYVDVVRAADALEERGLRGVFFVVPGWLNRSGVTTARRIAELVRRGHEVGNHTWSHPDIRKLPRPGQWRELVRARDRLADITGSTPARLAWPFGLHDGRSDAIAAELGYSAPRGITPREIFAPRLQTGAQLKRIPRRVFAGEPADVDEDVDE